MRPSAKQRFAKHILVATRNRLLLDNGLVNTRYRGNGYADYNRPTGQACVLSAVRTES
jgi:hypothetical protein